MPPGWRFRCPWCGVWLLAYGVGIGDVVACPNRRGGCGRPSRTEPGAWVPLYIKIARLI